MNSSFDSCDAISISNTSNFQFIHCRETPVPSPSRRVCSVPANKRVEMLRNCEADLRRELLKSQSKPANEVPENVINRKDSFETLAAPSSPVKISYSNGNGGRFSPRKTHLTNFINQNITPAELMRRPNSSDSQNIPTAASMEVYETKMKRSPCLQFNTINNRTKMTPPKSPMPRRRFRSQSPRICIESDSDSDTLNGNTPGVNVLQKKSANSTKRGDINRNKENKLRHTWRKSRQSVAQDDIINQNTIPISEVEKLDSADHRPFIRSIDMAHRITESFYCPQSEPLKRKIYSEKTLDRLQKSLDMESGMHIHLVKYFYRSKGSSFGSFLFHRNPQKGAPPENFEFTPRSPTSATHQSNQPKCRIVESNTQQQCKCQRK